jgi:hypothetical protein
MKDKDIRIQNITGIFEEGRSKGAPWCLIREPAEGHGIGKSKGFAQQFFAEIIPLRLPRSVSELEEIDEENGWRGNLETHEIKTGFASDWDEENTSWLPNEALAIRWAEIVKP